MNTTLQTPGHIGRRGLMLVLSSPSGAGKTTLARRLLECENGITPSVSATTRKPRSGEKNGSDYHFVSMEEFRTMRDGGAFLEHAEVFGNLYGSPRAPVEKALAAGGDVLFDIDWQGARQIRRNAPEDTVSVFLLPPAAGELHRRLRTRAGDAEEVVAARMAKAGDEISHYGEYDYIIVNDGIEESLASLRAILHAGRLRLSRLSGVEEFVRSLR